MLFLFYCGILSFLSGSGEFIAILFFFSLVIFKNDNESHVLYSILRVSQNFDFMHFLDMTTIIIILIKNQQDI